MLVLAVVVIALGASSTSTRDAPGAPARSPPAPHGSGATNVRKSRNLRKASNPFASTRLRDYLARRSGDVTAAVYDAKTHAIYLYRSGVHEQTASIMKVDILATLLHEVHARGRALTDEQGILAEQMIEDSNDDDAQDLWDEEGGSTAVGEFDADAGMHETVPNTAGYWGESTTTALDQVTLLEHLLLSTSLLDPASRKLEYDLMRDVTPRQRWGVSAGVPASATVALKDGWLPVRAGDWQVNSIGSIAGPGEHYLIAVLTNENPTEGYGIATIERISTATWDALA